MSSVVTTTIPVIVFFLMFTVGLELTLDDFRRVGNSLTLAVTATLAQFIWLPLLALVLILVLRPEPWLAAGMILVAASPSGAISNAFTLLAGANTALSVTLTAASSLVSLLFMPLLADLGFRTLLADVDAIEAPVAEILGQLLLLMMPPIALGLFAHHRWPEYAERQRKVLTPAAFLLVLALIALVLVEQWQLVLARIGEVLMTAVLFTVFAMAGGYLVGVALKRPLVDRCTLMFELSSRNLAIVTVVAAQTLGRLDVVVFAVAFFLVQAPFALLLAFWHRTRRTSST